MRRYWEWDWNDWTCPGKRLEGIRGRGTGARGVARVIGIGMFWTYLGKEVGEKERKRDKGEDEGV